MTYRRPTSRRLILAGTVASIVSAIVSLNPQPARAGNTWDGGAPLNGNWSAPVNWLNDTLPDFSTPITFAGSSNLLSANDLNALSVGGITFDAVAEAFTIRGAAINLTGPITNNAFTNQTINLAMTVDSTRTIDVPGASLTIGPGGASSGIISGAGGITKTGFGVLTLGATNTYGGTTTLDGGSVIYTADNTLSALNFGPVPTASTASGNTTTLDLTNANLTASSLAVQSNTSAPNMISIGTGKTLTVNGAVTVGVSEVFSNNFAGVRSALAVTGANWVVNSGAGHFTVGIPRSNAAGGGDPAATVDLAGLANFTYNATAGELRVGGGNVAGTLLLANTSNTIVAAQVRVGDSNLQPPGNGGNNNGGPGTLILGSGTNVINANTITIGATKTQGIVNFSDPVLGSITIAGQAGGNTVANITVGNATSATAVNVVSQLNLEGHLANIQAGTVIIGRLGGSTGGTGNGSISFDTGTFTAADMQLAVNAAGTAPNGAVGIFTLGGSTPNDTSTAILNVTNQFLLANRTNTANLTSIANGTFVINGGTANINTDIADASTSGDLTSRFTTLTLASGALDMMGHEIGSAASPITVVNLPFAGLTATLRNLGGGGINGAGLTMNGGGTLILDGTNSYTGTTTIAGGSILKVGKGLESGTLGTGDVVNDGLLIFDRTGSVTVTGAISGAGTIQKFGNGTLVLSGSGTYTGPTEVNQGTLSVTGGITSAVSVNNGGVLAGTGNGTTTGKVGNVTMAAGSSLRPGSTGASEDVGTLTVASLIVNGGDMRLDVDVSGDLVKVLGTANFAGASTITPSGAAAAGTYTVLTAGALTLGVSPTVVNQPNSRQTFTPDFSTVNTIKIVVVGNSKSLTWTGQANATWQAGAAGSLNWNDGAAADRFFNLDTVAFGNGPSSRNIAITGTVTPSDVSVNNDAGNDYVFSGGAIGGSASITKAGTGKLTLASANTHAGGVVLNAGTLNLNHSGALGAGLLTINGGSLDNTSGSAIVVATNNPQKWSGNFSFVGTNNLDLGTGGVTLATNPVLTVDANALTIGGAITGAFGLTKAGAGSLNLAGSNSMSGGVTLNGGILNINNSAALGTGAFTIAGGTIDNTSGGPINVTGNPPLNLNTNLAFTGSNALNLGAGVVTLSANLTVIVAANTLTIGGVIDGTFGVTKAGNGTLVLGGASSYTGAVNVDAGRLMITNATAADGRSSLGALTGGAVSVASGAALDLGGNPTVQALNFGAKLFRIAGTGIDGSGAITNTGVTQQNVLQHVTLNADASVGGPARFDIRSVPNTGLNASLDLANHTLTKSGPNQFSLIGVDVSDGNVIVNEGIFAIERATTITDFGTGRILTFNAGTTLQFFEATNPVSPVTRPMVFNGAGIRIGNASNAISYVGSNMTLNGDVTFTALNNTTAAGGLAVTGNLQETGGSRSVTKSGPNRLILLGTSNYTGTTTIEGGIIQVGDGGTSGILAAGNVINSGTLAFNRADDVTVPNAISGSGGVSQLGAGTMTLAGANTYTGATTVANGTVKVGTASSLPTGSSIVLGDAQNNSGIFDLAGFDGNVSGLSTVGVGVANIIGNSSTTASSVITFNASTTQFAGTIQDTLGAGTRSVALTVASGALTLSGNNSYTGPTMVNSGAALQIGSGFNTGTFGTGPVTVNGSIVFNRSDNFDVAVGIAGTGELKQNGTGRLILSAVNTLTGPTTVNGGALVVSGALNATSSVSVQGGALLGGKGTISTSSNGNVTLIAGSNLAPGDSVGTLTLALGTGSLDLSATAGLAGYLQFELGATADRILLNSGTLNIGTGGLDLDDFTFTNAGGLTEGTYVLFDTSGDIGGALGNHLQASLLGFDMTLQFANGVNGRDDLLLVVIPEPQSTTALVLGLGILASRRRKTKA